MQIDPEDFRRHYARLSDEALLAIDRTELVDAAQKFYDEEFKQRQLTHKTKAKSLPAPDVAVGLPAQPDDFKKAVRELGVGVEREPIWLEDAFCVFSFAAHPGRASPAVDEARAVLGAAGIPCYVTTHEIEPPIVTNPQPQYEGRLLVPDKLNLQAVSVLDKEIYNSEVEALWKAHLEALSDEDLRALDPQSLFAGLLDRIERVKRAYYEEIERRN